MERLSFDTTPVDEACAQVGSPHYESRARFEAAAYKEQLRRLYLSCHETRLPCRLEIKANPHNLGVYFSVDAVYAPGTPAEEAAFWLEANQPEAWDVAAFEQLRETVFAACLKDLTEALGEAPEFEHDGVAWLIVDPRSGDVLSCDTALSVALDQAWKELNQ